MIAARWAWSALIVPTILLIGALVRADRPRVVIVGPSRGDLMVTRVRDELTVLGFDVRVELEGESPGDLLAVARRSGAVAAARVGAAPPVIELWVDPVASITPAAPESLREPADPALLALRAVEVLRARLLPVPEIPVIAPPADAAPPPASPTASALAAPADAGPPPVDAGDGGGHASPAAGSFALVAGPAVLVSPGGVPAALHVRLGAEWHPFPRVGLEALVFVPVTASAITAAEGTADLRVLSFGGGIRGSLTDPRADFSATLGLGLAAMRLFFDARAAAPWMAVSGGAWAASPYGAASAAYRFHPRLAVRLDLDVALVRPQPIVRIAGREVASFGSPALFSSLGLEVRP